MRKPLVLIGMLTLFWTSMAMANQVTLDVSLANGKLLADQKQTTYLKVGLTGFELRESESRTPVNVALVLDKSGSMTGKKIKQAREAAIQAIQRLDENDIVSVIAYDSTVQVIVPATKLTDKSAVIEKINQITEGGATALFAGVSKGAAELKKFLDRDRVNRLILLSDGMANRGPKSPSELGDLGESLSKDGIAVSTLGLGLGYNEDLMVALANRSSGNHHFIEEAGQLVEVFNHEFDDVLSVVAQEVAITIDVEKGIRPVRVLNLEADINGQQVVLGMNQLYAQQEKYALLEVEVPATKLGSALKVATVNVTYSNMKTNKTDKLTGTVNVAFVESRDEMDKTVQAKVMEEVVILISNETNKLATQYRDQGKTVEAEALLTTNSKFLNKWGVKLGSLRCVECADMNDWQASNLRGAKYGKTRKTMREGQFKIDNQQQERSKTKMKVKIQIPSESGRR